MMKVILTLLLLICSSGHALAKEKLNIFGWSMLPVLHEGRIKPVDSFAQIYLKTFSGKDTVDGMSAAEWLAESIFTPDKAVTTPLFKSHTTAEPYSYQDLSEFLKGKEKNIKNLLEKPAGEWSLDQQELMRLYENFILYSQILESLFEEGGGNNVLLRIIKDKNEWLSPWDFTNKKSTSPEGKKYLKQWHRMAIAYSANDSNAWRTAVQSALALEPNIKISIEVLYNKFSFLNIALTLYGICFVFFIVYSLSQKIIFEKFSFTALAAGAFIHTIDIALRIYILERPPVGTLYESILFVALICTAGCLFMAWKQKNSSNTLLGGLSGLILLTTANAFAAEDTMGTLVAVLNTNFWLSTHVICITIGYGCCLITSLMAHYYLIKDTSSQLFKNIKTLSILSLLFVTVGTILGGLWADQSWGRFWGWDPKENGALLIALWLIWILHGRLSKHINDLAFVVGMAALSIIVVLAWFGVNLLNVGLHSYGFISGVAWGIALFCVFEIIIIGGLWFYKNKKAIA